MGGEQKWVGGLSTDRRHRFRRIDPDWEVVEFVVLAEPVEGGVDVPDGADEDEDDGWEIVEFVAPREDE